MLTNDNGKDNHDATRDLSHWYRASKLSFLALLFILIWILTPNIRCPYSVFHAIEEFLSPSFNSSLFLGKNERVANTYKVELATIIQWDALGEKQRRYKFGDYILRERKGRYYIYKLETKNGEIKKRYVGSLTDVVETY